MQTWFGSVRMYNIVGKFRQFQVLGYNIIIIVVILSERERDVFFPCHFLSFLGLVGLLLLLGGVWRCVFYWLPTVTICE